MKPFVVIGWDDPDQYEGWDAPELGLKFCALTKKLGLVPHVDLKHGPLEGAEWYSFPLHAEMRVYTFDTKQAEAWHYDGDITPGANPHCGMVTWASSSPTEIEFEGKIYQAKPREIILFSNFDTKHRRPEGCKPYRWLFRQRVAMNAAAKELLK